MSPRPRPSRPVSRLLAGLLVVVLGAASACGDDGDDGGGAGATTTVAGSAVDSTTTVAPSTTAATTTTAAATTTTAAAIEIPDPAATTVDGVLALDRPVVIGHAGGDQSWPHSTMYAFTEAARAGTDVLEMDVQLTGDGVLVVQHDDTVDRTTETTGAVRELSYDELQALDNGYWWSSEWSSHEEPDDAYVYRGIRTGDVAPPEGYTADDFRVETFRAVAEAFPDHVLDIEIKLPDGADGETDLDFAIEGARVLAEEIESLGRTDSVVVVSFDDDVMAAFHEFAPDVATSPGTDAMTDWYFSDAELLPSDTILQIPPFFEVNGAPLDILNLPGFLDKAREQGLAVWVWPNDAGTQENPDFYAELVTTYAVDGVIAGHPEQAVERYRAEGWL